MNAEQLELRIKPASGQNLFVNQVENCNLEMKTGNLKNAGKTLGEILENIKNTNIKINQSEVSEYESRNGI